MVYDDNLFVLQVFNLVHYINLNPECHLVFCLQVIY